jgi:hypothetical protein
MVFLVGVYRSSVFKLCLANGLFLLNVYVGAGLESISSSCKSGLLVRECWGILQLMGYACEYSDKKVFISR